MVNLIFIMLFGLVNSNLNDYYSEYKRRIYEEESANYSIYPPLADKVVGNGKSRTLYQSFNWLARIVPSPTSRYPTLCTCVCLSKKVFVSSARCVIGLTVGYVSIRLEYGEPSEHYNVLVTAIIVPKPSEASKQYHEDAGLLVTEDHGHTWRTVSELIQVKREQTFDWLLNQEKDPNYDYRYFILVGYQDDVKVNGIYQLSIRVGLAIKYCQEIYSRNYSIPGFRAPCVYTCVRWGYDCERDDELNYGIQFKGSAIVGIYKHIYNKYALLIGVATWAGTTDDPNDVRYLPVGIAILNSQNFLNDYACALKIRDSSEPPPYQNICD